MVARHEAARADARVAEEMFAGDAGAGPAHVGSPIAQSGVTDPNPLLLNPDTYAFFPKL